MTRARKDRSGGREREREGTARRDGSAPSARSADRPATDPTAATPRDASAPGSETPALALARDGAGGGANAFALKIATVNGTGSASANGLLRQAIFRMGIPVSGKNLFPSNIQGLPTWYEIRVNGDGHTARTPAFDLVVAVNPATYARDLAELRPGGWLLHDATWPWPREVARDDVVFLGVPMAKLCAEHFEGARARILMKNIVYVGALAALLGIEPDVVNGLLEETFARKKKLLDANFLAFRLGHDYAAAHFDCPLPIRLERMAATKDSILIDGNTAAALGCVYAGATVAAWYPITPSTSLIDAFTAFCDRFRKDPESGKNRYCILQAEDELAAAGMVVGANWVGARAFTATSGPGISLMSEFIGLAYYAEIPSVFFDIQRTGPSTGMPTRTQQGDLFSVVFASHGDTEHIALFPADPRECFDFAVRAFDLAERYQTPVFVVSDLDIGMNDWVVPRLEWDDAYRPDRGKVLSAEDLERIEKFHRYLDVDGDGIAARTVPGVHPKGAFFTRGSGHDKHGRYTEDADAYTEVMERLARKIAGAAAHVPSPVVVKAPMDAETPVVVETQVAGEAPVVVEAPAAASAGGGAPVAATADGAAPRPRSAAAYGIVSIGSCDRAVLEAAELLGRRGIHADYLRVRAFPFADAVREFLAAHPVNFVVEQNRDAQLRRLLALYTGTPLDRLVSVRNYGGLPMAAAYVVDEVVGWVRDDGRRSDGQKGRISSGTGTGSAPSAPGTFTGAEPDRASAPTPRPPAQPAHPRPQGGPPAVQPPAKPQGGSSAGRRPANQGRRRRS